VVKAFPACKCSPMYIEMEEAAGKLPRQVLSDRRKLPAARDSGAIRISNRPRALSEWYQIPVRSAVSSRRALRSSNAEGNAVKLQRGSGLFPANYFAGRMQFDRHAAVK